MEEVGLVDWSNQNGIPDQCETERKCCIYFNVNLCHLTLFSYNQPSITSKPFSKESTPRTLIPVSWSPPDQSLRISPYGRLFCWWQLSRIPTAIKPQKLQKFQRTVWSSTRRRGVHQQKLHQRIDFFISEPKTLLMDCRDGLFWKIKSHSCTVLQVFKQQQRERQASQCFHFHYILFLQGLIVKYK